jgi:hypothetical protein
LAFFDLLKTNADQRSEKYLQLKTTLTLYLKCGCKRGKGDELTRDFIQFLVTDCFVDLKQQLQ